MSTLKAHLKKIKKICVRGRDYRIKFEKQLRSDHGHPLHGYCDSQNKTIVLSDDSPEYELLDTFLHEYFHAIWYESGIYSEDIPTWIEHIYLTNISHDMLINKKLILKLLQLDK